MVDSSLLKLPVHSAKRIKYLINSVRHIILLQNSIAERLNAVLRDSLRAIKGKEINSALSEIQFAINNSYNQVLKLAPN